MGRRPKEDIQIVDDDSIGGDDIKSTTNINFSEVMFRHMILFDQYFMRPRADILDFQMGIKSFEAKTIHIQDIDSKYREEMAAADREYLEATNQTTRQLGDTKKKEAFRRLLERKFYAMYAMLGRRGFFDQYITTGANK